MLRWENSFEITFWQKLLKIKEFLFLKKKIQQFGLNFSFEPVIEEIFTKIKFLLHSESNSFEIWRKKNVTSPKENIIFFNNDFVTWLLPPCFSCSAKSQFFLQNTFRISLYTVFLCQNNWNKKIYKFHLAFWWHRENGGSFSSCRYFKGRAQIFFVVKLE